MRTLALALVATAAGCSADEPPANETANATPAAVAPPVANVVEAPKREPETEKTFDFAGDWAVSEALCADNGVWSFARDKVEIGGETSCTVESITGETATGATLTMNCTAEGTSTKQRWALFTAPEGRMTVQRYENDIMTTPQQVLERCR